MTVELLIPAVVTSVIGLIGLWVLADAYAEEKERRIAKVRAEVRAEALDLIRQAWVASYPVTPPTTELGVVPTGYAGRRRA